MNSSGAMDIDPANSIIDCGTPSADVSAFCQATLSRLIPNEMWGTRQVGEENRSVIMRYVDRFILARRFESLSLHALSEGLKARTI